MTVTSRKIKPSTQDLNRFSSAHSALQWAFTVSSVPIIKQPSINHMYGRPKATSKNELLRGLTRDEACKQAQNIIGIINRLDDTAMKQYLFAYYAGRTDDKDISMIMTKIFSSFGSAISRRRGIRKIVLKYLGHDIGKREIRDALKCNRNDVEHYISSVYDVLDTLHNNSLDSVENELKNKGLV